MFGLFFFINMGKIFYMLSIGDAKEEKPRLLHTYTITRKCVILGEEMINQSFSTRWTGRQRSNFKSFQFYRNTIIII